jgi:O-antigen/teichoic acid export membrane protein
MEESKMKKHVTVVGALHIGFGVLGLIGAIAIFFALSFARGFVANEDVPSHILGFLSISLPLLIGSISTLGLVGGIALFSYKNWARILVLIVAAMGCLNIPIGTLKGVYSIWVLMQDDTIKMFRTQ